MTASTENLLSQEQMALIEKQAELGVIRLSGIFFMKHLGHRMSDETGMITPFAEAAILYFNSLKRQKEAKEFHASLAKQKVRHEAKMQDVKRSNQSVKKSSNLSLANVKSKIHWVVNGERLDVTLNVRNGLNPAKLIRQHLKSKGINRMGTTIDNGVSFNAEAMKEILTWFANRTTDAVNWLVELCDPITSLTTPVVSQSTGGGEPFTVSCST